MFWCSPHRTRAGGWRARTALARDRRSARTPGAREVARGTDVATAEARARNHSAVQRPNPRTLVSVSMTSSLERPPRASRSSRLAATSWANPMMYSAFRTVNCMARSSSTAAPASAAGSGNAYTAAPATSTGTPKRRTSRARTVNAKARLTCWAHTELTSISKGRARAWAAAREAVGSTRSRRDRRPPRDKTPSHPDRAPGRAEHRRRRRPPRGDCASPGRRS